MAFVAPWAGAEELGQVDYRAFPDEEEPSHVAQLDDDLEVIEGDSDVTSEYSEDDAELLEPETIEPGTVEEVPYDYIDEGQIIDEELGTQMAPVLSSADDIKPCDWYGRIDFVQWVRSRPKRLALAIDTSPIDDLLELIQLQRPLGAGRASFRIEPGARVTLAHNLGRDAKNRDNTVEVVYLGGFNWSSTAAKTSRDPRELNTTLALSTVGGFQRSDLQSIRLESDLNSIAFNVRLQRRPHSDKMVLSPDGRWSRQMQSTFVSSFLAGMRYVRATDDFNWQSRLLDGDGNLVPADDFIGNYDIDTENNLVGLHVGTDTYWQSPNLRLGMRTQFGVFVNIAEVQSNVLIIDDDPQSEVTGTFNRSVNDEAASFIGEMGWSATYQFRPNIACRASYDFMWAQGLAGATRQIDFNFAEAPRVNFGENIFYQGFSIGVEFVW